MTGRSEPCEQELFQKVVEQAADTIVVVACDGAILYSNPQAERSFGYGADELRGKTLFELIHQEDRARVVELFDRDLEGRAEPLAFTARLRRRDGTWLRADALTRPLAEESPSDGFVVTLRVISAQPVVKRRAMDTLSAYVKADSEGRVLACNPAFIRIFGFASEELARATDFWSLFLQSDLRDKLAEMIGTLGKVENLEIQAKKSDGSVIHLLANIVGRLGPGGEIEDLEAQILDVSEKRKLEQQWGRAERMEALGRLSCAVAHDFNNLLTAILGYAELVRNAFEPGSRHSKSIEEIRKAGMKASSLTRQLLTFGKGKIVEVKVVQVNEVVDEMHSLLVQLIGGGIELALDLATDLAPIKIDKSQVEQVILNLAINARDAMEDGGRLTIRTVNQRVERPFVLHHDSVQPGDYTMLSIRDTGHGIDPLIMDRLFEPFFTTKGQGKGTGLGLSTVYGIVKQNGGFISVYNEPQGGVTFKVSFPSVAEGAEAARPERARGVVASRRKRTVLLAEDDDAVRRLVEDTLRAAGYETLVASDGQAALELADNHPGEIDLLLTDISMPQLDGLALVDRFSTTKPTVPVLLLSGTVTVDPSALDSESRVEFLEKPFTPAELLQKIREVL